LDLIPKGSEEGIELGSYWFASGRCESIAIHDEAFSGNE